MANGNVIRFYYEGDDDKALLERLIAGKFVSGEFQIADRDKKYSGKDGVVHQVAPFVRPLNGVAGDAIVLIDVDDSDVDGVRDWFEKELKKHLPQHDPPIEIATSPTGSPRVFGFKLSFGERIGQVALVVVGLSVNEELQTERGIEKFAIDDHLLLLACDKEVYGALSDFKDVAYDTAMKKLSEMAELLRSNGLPVRNSKRYLRLLRTVVDFRPSSATFVERLVRSAIDAVGNERFRELMSPLLDDLDEAVKVVSG